MTVAVETPGSARYTVRGIVKRDNRWTAVERTIDATDDRILSAKLIAGPFTGTGAKRAAIQAAGTNEVLA